MARIILVRHGQDTDNAKKILNGHRDTNLTKLGQKQAKIAGKKLKEENIDIIYCSTLKRAKQTAKIISKQIKVNKIYYNKSLIERDLGVYTGKLFSEIPNFPTRIITVGESHFFLVGKNVEPFSHVYKRTKQFLKIIQAKHPKKNIVLVTHEGTAKMMRAAYYKWGIIKGLKATRIDNSDIVKLRKIR